MTRTLKLAGAGIAMATAALLGATPASADTPGAGYYQVKSELTGMCASVGNNSTSAGIEVPPLDRTP